MSTTLIKSNCFYIKIFYNNLLMIENNNSIQNTHSPNTGEHIVQAYARYPYHVLREAMAEIVGDPNQEKVLEELATVLALREQPDLAGSVTEGDADPGHYDLVSIYGSPHISTEALNAPRNRLHAMMQKMNNNRPQRPYQSVAEWSDSVGFNEAQDRFARKIIDGAEQTGAQQSFLALTQQKELLVERWKEYRAGLRRATGIVALKLTAGAAGGAVALSALAGLGEALERIERPSISVIIENELPDGWSDVIFDEDLPNSESEPEVPDWMMGTPLRE